jgi:hypothetical protein
MLYLIPPDRSYDPETIGLMTTAYERVCQSAPHLMNCDENVKERLARIILRQVDKGVRDPKRLAAVALWKWTGADHSEVG